MAEALQLYTLTDNGIPPFDSLPLRKGDPPYSAWGLYGDDDELGTLNRLTDERVLAAARSEIRTGARYSSTESSTNFTLTNSISMAESHSIGPLTLSQMGPSSHARPFTTK